MRYFSYDPQSGFDLHETLDEAVDAANSAIDYYRDEAADGWSEDVANVCYGSISGFATMCDETPAPEGSAVDYICDYRLQDLDP